MTDCILASAVDTKEFKEALTKFLNMNNIDTFCQTPDYILADYLVKCLHNFAVTLSFREVWFGRMGTGEGDANHQGRF